MFLKIDDVMVNPDHIASIRFHADGAHIVVPNWGEGGMSGPSPVLAVGREAAERLHRHLRWGVYEDGELGMPMPPRVHGTDDNGAPAEPAAGNDYPFGGSVAS